MTTGSQEDRDPLDAFWDTDDPVRGIGEALGYALVVAAVAIIGVSLWSHAGRSRSSPRRVVPSAADIHVRPPPPK